jgi:hypothetical protein
LISKYKSTSSSLKNLRDIIFPQNNRYFGIFLFGTDRNKAEKSCADINADVADVSNRARPENPQGEIFNMIELLHGLETNYPKKG